MRRIVKWLGIIAGGVVGLLLLLFIVAFINSSSRINRVYAVPASSLEVETDAESIANGEHLAQVFCADCHGEDFGGRVFLDDPMIGTIPSANLTSGAGGFAATYTDADFEAAIRHGVGPDGKGSWIMPSEDFTHLSDADVADIVAYLHSVTPVDSTPAAARLTPVARVMIMFNAVSLLSAEHIDHSLQAPAAVQPGRTAEYGEYLARTCTGCHGQDYAGGPSPAPGDPPAANLTPDETAGLGTWTEADFFTAIRTGTRPDGSQLNPAMPWRAYSTLTDDELGAIWLYLQSLPAVDTQS